MTEKEYVIKRIKQLGKYKYNVEQMFRHGLITENKRDSLDYITKLQFDRCVKRLTELENKEVAYKLN